VEALSAENASLRSINGVLDKVVNLRDEHIGGLQQALQVRAASAPGGRAVRLLAGLAAQWGGHSSSLQRGHPRLTARPPVGARR
jgi:hypothetical protein